MPRAGLGREAVLDAAEEILARDGAASLTLAKIARRLGVRTPSLYHHVDGLDGLRRALRLRGFAGLRDALGEAALGRSGDDAVRELAHAYRRWAAEHPGLYELTLHGQSDADPEDARAAFQVVRIVTGALRGYGLAGDDALHAARILRATLHGFVALEAADGFGLDLDPTVTFERLVDGLVDGMARTGSDAGAHADADPGAAG